MATMTPHPAYGCAPCSGTEPASGRTLGLAVFLGMGLLAVGLFWLGTHGE